MPTLPRWFVAGLAAAVVWVGAAGVVGVFLLTVGWYQPAVVMLAATASAVAVAFLAVRRLDSERPAHAAALAAAGLGLCFLVLAGVFHSEHLLTDRDPAAYVNNGRMIARTHELHPVVRSGAFSNGHEYTMNAASFNEGPNGRLDMNFFPMLPVLLALGWTVGGDTGLLLVPVLLGTIGLLTCYALASRLLGARAALWAAVLLAIEPLQLWFARDAYSELVVQVVVLGGIWLVLEARDRAVVPLAIVAGALVASSALARIDVLAIGVGVLAFVGLEWVRADTDDDPVRARRFVLGFGGTLVVGLGIALIWMLHVAHHYIVSLGSDFRSLVAVMVVALVGVIGAIVLHRVRPGIGHRIASVRAVPVAATVVAIGAVLWAAFLRPDPLADLPVVAPGHPVPGELRQAINHWHWSRSLHWFTSYFGVVAVAVGVGGLVCLGWRMRAGNRAATAIFCVVVPSTLLYVASPSITPDQPWAMRRYLPVVIPGLVIAIATVLSMAIAAAWRVRGTVARAAAVGGTVLLVGAVAVPSAVAARVFVRARFDRGALAAVHEVCRGVGRDSAVLVYGGANLGVELPQTVRGFCGVPVAAPRNYKVLDLGALSAQWHALGRQLFVATATPDAVRAADPSVVPVLTATIGDQDNPEKVFDHHPVRKNPSRRDIFVFRVPPASVERALGLACAPWCS